MYGWALPLFAVAAGFVSFASPCCIPLVPGYLSYVSAIPTADLGDRARRRVVVGAALGFVGGFTLVFTALGIGASSLSSVLIRNQRVMTRWAGLLVIVLALSNLHVLNISVFKREKRVDMARIPRGPSSSVLVGMAFAAGWAPCIGPVLATILTTAAVTQTALWGGALLALYGIGLGIPFVLLAVGFSRAQRSLSWLRLHGRGIERAGALTMLAVGVLFASGRWQRLFLPMQRWFAELGWPPI